MTLATGNNVGPRGDVVRRTIVCNIGANVERPELRFFDSDPLETVRANRGPWLWACFQVMRAYILAGRPPVKMTPLGSYREWSTTVRAALIWLGEEDPVKSMEQAREQDPTLEAIRELFTHWRQHFTSQKYTALKIAEHANKVDISNFNKPLYPELRDLLIREAGDRGMISTKALGWWLTQITGKVVDGMRLQSEPGRKGGHGKTYFLDTMDALTVAVTTENTMKA
jgi:hypothetical protein